MTRRAIVSNALQSIGLLVLALGVGLIYVPAGVITGALSAVVYGLAIERGEDHGTSESSPPTTD